MKKRTIIRIVYICIFLIISFIPLFGVDADQKTIGNEVKMKMPSITTEKGLNFDYFLGVDDFFAQNFGMRNKLVQLGNTMKSKLFGISGNDTVIKGKEGWLYLGNSAADFLGRNVLSDVQISKIANSFDIAANYVKSQDKTFVFTVAPNKASIYGEYMPYNYIKSSEPGNYEKLFAKLSKYDLITVDLKKELNNNKNTFDTTIYHKLDSHWNNLGAAVAYEAIMSKLDGYVTKNYTNTGFGIVKDFKGDLLASYLPESTELDDQIKLNIFDGIVYDDSYRGVDDTVFSTTNTLAVNDKSVVLYRDSFGRTLHWFFANDFANALIKREIPYNIYEDAKQNDVIVVEIVERNIKNFLNNVPIAPSFKVEADGNAFKTKDGRVIVDVYGNSDNIKTTEEKVEAFGNFKKSELYEITFNCDLLEDYADIYLMLYNSNDGITLYQTMPAGKDCNATIYLLTDDYEYVTVNSDNAYIAAVDANGGTVRLPINITFQN